MLRYQNISLAVDTTAGSAIFTSWLISSNIKVLPERRVFSSIFLFFLSSSLHYLSP